jgi:predicted ester cyclase
MCFVALVAFLFTPFVTLFTFCLRRKFAFPAMRFHLCPVKIFHTGMKRFLSFFVLLICSASMVSAAGIKGRILESATSEVVIGATITVGEMKQAADVSGLDGSYHISNVPAGSYTLVVSYAGMKTHTETVQLTDEESTTVNIKLQSNVKELNAVTVTSKKDGASENIARSMERNSGQVMNIISGKAIQLSPDLTVANVIQRISGISIERNSNGDGQFAILRGMDKRYNYTLVNGIKIPSPDNKYRYVPLDIFPSELLERLEVYKALTPSMEGDAIGGAVNMVMKDAPDKFILQANIATGYSELFLDRDFMGYGSKSVNAKSPYEINGEKYNATPSDFNTASYDYTSKKPLPNGIGGLTIGNRFFNKKLGVILSGNFQNTYRGSNSDFYGIDKVDTFKGVTLTGYNQRQYSEQQTRSGLHSKLDYRFNSRNKIQWYNAYMSLNNVQVRDSRETQLTIGGYDPEKGNATLGYSTRSRLTKQQIFNSTLQGEHYLAESLKLNWSAVYSKAAQQQPDNTNIPLTGKLVNFVETKTYIGDATRRWEHNSDQDKAGYLNLTYTKPIAGVPVEWMIGGLYRDKKRNNFYNQYVLRPSNLKALYGVDFNEYTDINWTVQNPRGSVGSALSYDAFEKIAAGFLQFKVAATKLEVVGGARAENTDQGYAMQFPIGEDRPDGEQKYLDFLPSLHFKYMPNRKTNVRASYFRSINRPGFFEIVPYKIVYEEYQERGNPDLKRAVADNIDLRYELYPSPGEQIMAGVFYKRIQDPIEYTLQRDPVRGQDIFYAPGNFGTATNYGIELDFIKYIKKFGVKANYTYTHSAITTPKSQRIRDEKGDLQTISVEQTRPLYGQAAHIANLSLLYKDVKQGWDVQLVGNYTGERIVTVAQFLNNDLWQKGFIQMDFSIEKSFHKKWSIYAKANNLLNTPSEVYMKTNYNNKESIPGQDLSGQTLIKKDFYERSYVLGVRWQL